jgi:NADPH:quinone reductase-like Zn-dependent oxidoreductase
MRAVRLTAFGNPVDGLEYVDILEPDAPGPNQVLIGVEFSPINANARHLRIPPPASNRHRQ